MTLWIDEMTSEQDQRLMDLALLLGTVLNYPPAVKGFLMDTPGTKMESVTWPLEFKPRAFWSTYVADLRREGGLRPLVAHAANEFPPQREQFEQYLRLRS